MEVLIKGIKTNYEKEGTGEKSVVLLHGWGQNVEMMRPIMDHLKDRFTVYNLDFPGFGNSDEPAEAYSVYDYCDHLKEFLDHFSVTNPIIIAHSFGCRIGIIYASRYPCHKLVFTGAAGVIDKRGLDYYAKVYSYKAAKNVLTALHMDKTKEKLMSNSGSSDYQNTSGVMRQTFVKVVNEDLTYLLKDIKAETLLVFGENDTDTPVWKGKVMEKEIPNSALVIFENDDHFAYWHQMNRFNRVLDAFFEGD